MWYGRPVAWWEDFCATEDNTLHNYRATEYSSAAGSSVQLDFEEFGSFRAFSEEEAIKYFKDWYVQTRKDNLSDKVRQPPLWNGDGPV